jgi:hypothetical protein
MNTHAIPAQEAETETEDFYLEVSYAPLCCCH